MKLAALLSLALALTVQAQYEITWSTMDAGGGQSAGGAYTLNGTAGQPDAGVHGAGPYTLAGGFWGAFSAAPSEPVPSLRIVLSGPNVLLAWPDPSTGFQLQESAGLESPAWNDVLTVPGVVGTEKQVTIGLHPGPRYYRLRKL